MHDPMRDRIAEALRTHDIEVDHHSARCSCGEWFELDKTDIDGHLADVAAETAAPEIAALRTRLDDETAAKQIAAEALDRFRDVVLESIGVDITQDGSYGDDTMLAALRSHFGNTGPEPRQWRDFMVWANARRDQINAAHTTGEDHDDE